MVAKNSKYSSTRYHDGSLREFFGFEDVVLKGLAADGGLFHPHDIPDVRSQYLQWKDLSFADLAYQVMRLYIDETEISNAELKDIVDRSYSTFRHPDTVPLVALDEQKGLYLLELFHGPTFAFKDVALQFLGNLFEFFLVRKNENMNKNKNAQTGEGEATRHHLTVIGATSGDTGSAAIYGLRGKKDVSIFIMFPDGKVSPVQEAQMTTVLDPNVHCLSVQGTFDDCQDYVKALFADPETNKIHHLAAVNSINWARILAQITYYFSAYFQLLKTQPDLKQAKFVVPTGNFGDILAGYYAKRMGLPIAKLVIATNENDILHRFWQTGSYSKKPKPAREPHEGLKEDGAQAHEAGVKETYSPAMDILVSSNFERLLWHLSLEHELETNPHVKMESSARKAGQRIDGWFQELKSTGSFTVDPQILDRAREIFGTYRVSNAETLGAIRDCYRGDAISKKEYVLDPHSAIGVAASLREIKASGASGSGSGPGQSDVVPTVSLATAHPAKFAGAVELALQEEKAFDFNTVLPEQFVGLDDKERKVLKVSSSEGLAGIRQIITREVHKEKEARQNGSS
ncbi:threonine synthase [Exophiala xenobiotica]|nr:threonine synthase [Exophiala xenobiotica]KAK5199837.1 threonine synthase [Exophiala xenobiotica]KAK5211006.1 threonine synthase [Exophiala xenobiotica]KAK5237459.1 threonine synthase [Exophiala xenobiotica]KAK5254622.1 threonine synthase [Exophiala xenobiotica]